MAKKIIRTGTTADPIGDSLKNAFIKVNDNFTELYNALGLDEGGLNLGAFEFTGSVMTTTDSSAIVIDQATTITSNLSVGGDILPQTANGGDLGSSARPWRSLYVSNNTIYIGGTALSVNGAGNLTVNGSLITGGGGGGSTLVNGANTLRLGSDGVLTLPGGRTRIGASLDSDAIIANEDEAFGVLAQGTNGAVQLVWVEDLENAYTSNLAAVYVNSGGPGSVRIATGANGSPGPNHWEFNRYGALTFPQGTTIATADGSDAFVIDGAVDKDVQIYTYSGATARGWTFGTDGSLKIPGDIKSQGNINIDINLADSTLRRWQFGEDGDLILPAGGDIKNSTGTSVLGGSVSSLVNSTKTVSLGSDGSLTIPGDIKSDGNINIDINLSDSTLRRWQFGEDGALTLPEGGRINALGYNNIVRLGNDGFMVANGAIFNENEDGLYLGGQNSDAGTYIQIPGRTASENGEPLIISHNWDAAIEIRGVGGTWSFDEDASITLPNYGQLRPSSATYDAALAGWESFRSQEAESAALLGYTEAMRPFIGWRVNGGNVAAYLAELNRVWAIQNTGGATLVWTPAITSALRGQMRAAMLAVQNAYPSVGSDISIASGQGKYWNFSGDGTLTIPGDIKSEGNINIDINLADSTLRRWQFGEDGNLTFPDGTNQSTAATTYTLPTATTSVLGGVKVDGTSVTISNGIISLNAGLAGSVTFKGGWDANTNTPTLANGTGTAGFMYIVTTNGVTNLGAGLTSFSSGDLVIYDGTNWINVAANNGVVSFNSRTGAVTLTSGDVTTALGYTPYNATNPNSYISSITSGNVTTALGYTPYNATNPNSYIAASSLSVTTNTASGAGSLSYSAGVFTFTPAVAYTLPTATPSVLGGIKIDNNTIVINDGVISVGGALTSATIFKGSWDASANTPTLGSSLPAGVAAGWQYIVSVQGTRDIGAGSTVYTVGDLVIYNGTSWSRIPGGNTVTAFNSRQGAITLTSSDVTTALGFTPISLASVSGYQFYVAADDSTQQLVSSDEVIKFIGARGVTTTSDPEGAITITGPDLTTYATQSYVTSRGYLTSVDYSIVTNKPVIPDQFTFNVAADDSTMRTIGSEETIKFIGSGGITTTTDAEGNVNIILGSLNAVNLIGTTLAASVVNSSLTSVGTLTRLNVSRDVTARGFNTDSITMIGNRIATTVTNANLEIEFSGTGGLVANNVADATTASTAKSVGYLGLPQSGTSTTATLAMSDAGKHIYITSTGQTITIPAASSVAYPIGTTLTFISGSSATTTTIAIATDTLRLAGGTSTGSRTLAANGMATAVKVSGASSSGVWYINGTGLT